MEQHPTSRAIVELWGEQAQGVAECLELARHVVRARVGFHADQAQPQTGDQFQEFGAWNSGRTRRLAELFNPMHGEDVQFFARSIPTVTMVMIAPLG